MPLSAGDELGPYDVIASIGAGGMGEVYKARDTRLDRTVAIKVLPEHIAKRADLRARFEREARTVASLNHPNICTLYDIGNQEGVGGFMVMELIEGKSLAARIEKSAIPLEQALSYATQIADALDRAHRAGVTHRDVKPSNIMLTRDGVKVLDFGLAKSQPKPGPTDETLTAMLTTEGTIMGTPQYMAPEQFEGKEADARSDIWAFGAVLYEMVTGQKAFQGRNYTSLVAAILGGEPAPMVVQPFAPRWLERLVRRCLEKDPDDRYQSMRDVVLELRKPPQESAAGGPLQKAGRWPLALAAATSLIAIVLGAAYWLSAHSASAPLKPLVRLHVNLGPDAITGSDSRVEISPDGTRIVFSVRKSDGTRLLATRLLDQTAVTPLAGTENGVSPFFSPDGQWIGFYADRNLKKVLVSGGMPVILDGVGGLTTNANWGENGEIVADYSRRGLNAIPVGGGAPRFITEASQHGERHVLPQVLPGGHAVLFTAVNRDGLIDSEVQDIRAVSLQTGAVKTLTTGAYGRYLPSNGSSGHLVYVRHGALYAVAFDPVRLEVRGSPEQILSDVPATQTRLPFSWAANGTFVYPPVTEADRESQKWPIVWMDRSGKTEPLLKIPDRYRVLRLSPDGRRLVLDMATDQGPDIFVYDLARDTLSRLTFKGGHDFPVWTPDGAHLIFRSRSATGSQLSWIRADGSGEIQVLLERKNVITPYTISPDGRLLVYEDWKTDGDQDIWILPLDTSDPEHPKPGRPAPFLQTPALEGQPDFSPDGRYIAYISRELAARFILYVRPAPGLDGKSGPGQWQVSTGAAGTPKWSPNGRELFYLDNGRIWVSGYTVNGAVFTPGKPRLWSSRPIRQSPYVNYSPAPDGKRFAVYPVAETLPEAKDNRQVTFLLHFGDELRRKVPVGK